jgi:hypothetical protein
MLLLHCGSNQVGSNNLTQLRDWVEIPLKVITLSMY